jgi:hypothetical protein
VLRPVDDVLRRDDRPDLDAPVDLGPGTTSVRPGAASTGPALTTGTPRAARTPAATGTAATSTVGTRIDRLCGTHGPQANG